MIKVKDGYAKLIGTTYLGSASRVLLSNGSDHVLGNASGNIPLSNGTVNTNLNSDLLDGVHLAGYGGKAGVMRSWSRGTYTTVKQYFGNGNIVVIDPKPTDDNTLSPNTIIFSLGDSSIRNTQLAFMYERDEIKYRRVVDGPTWGAWKTIAFTDSDISGTAAYANILKSNNTTSVPTGLQFYSGWIPQGNTNNRSWCSPTGNYTNNSVKGEYGSIVRVNYGNTYYNELFFDANSTRPTWRKITGTNSTGWKTLGLQEDIRHSGYVTSAVAGLSSYWGKLWEATHVANYNDVDITFYIHSAFNQKRGFVHIRVRRNPVTTDGVTTYVNDVNMVQISGNIPTSDIRLYHDATTGKMELWLDVKTRWGVYNANVVSCTQRFGNEVIPIVGTLLSNDFTTVQTLPTYSYVTLNNLNSHQVHVQQHTNNSIEYPLVWSNQTDTNNVTTDQLYKSYPNLTYNPHVSRITASSFKARDSIYANGQIELQGSTPYIDFHYNNSTEDFTNRIIEGLAGQLTVTGKLRVGLAYNTSTNYKFYVNGSTYLSSLDIGIRAIIDSNGYFYPADTNRRTGGIYGVYDSTRVGHVWSIGTSYRISDDGSNTGNIYGLVFFHTNWSNVSTYNDASKTEVSTYAGGHQIALVQNGKVDVSLGDYVWSRRGFKKDGSSDNHVLLGGGGHKALSTLQSEYDSRYVNITGDTMTGRLSMKTTIKDHSQPTDHCLVINSDAVPSGTTLTLKNAPGIGFHISSYDWGSLVFNGKFNFIDNTSNGYMDVNLKALSASSTISGNYFTSRVATGTQPYACTSTTLNTNLNADLLDGQHLNSIYTLATADDFGTTSKVPSGFLTYYTIGTDYTNSPQSLIQGNQFTVINHLRTSSKYGAQLAFGFGSDYLAIRRRGDSTTWGAWSKIKAGSADNADTLDGIHANGLLTALSSNTTNKVSITVGGTTKNITTLYASYLCSVGVVNPQTGRTQAYGNVYSYNTNLNYHEGAPTTYTSVIGFGRGAAGGVEICGEWTSGRGLWVRALRDTIDDWYAWDRILTEATYKTVLDSRYLPTNYYWANVPISATSSTTTTPTFGSVFINTGDPTLKIYSGRVTDAKSDGNICLQTCIDGQDGQTHSYAPNFPARENLVLQPRGGQVYIGTNPDGGNTSYKLWVNGNTYASGSQYAAHFYENSDAKLKENIQAILNSDKMPIIKEFDWKEDNSHSYGLIAQELEEQGYSELVSVKDDGYKTVNYSAALSLIVGKLQVKIKELEKEIENLKNKN